ncbi:hypothetical protein MJO29_007158 [Puccinia striiformis f. sp. tritici]|nr:hypothetical protein MJO29_007158 [Puccinia striiformis f. sp. tritici]
MLTSGTLWMVRSYLIDKLVGLPSWFRLSFSSNTFQERITRPILPLVALIIGDELVESHQQLFSQESNGLRLSDSLLDSDGNLAVANLTVAVAPQSSTSVPPDLPVLDLDLTDPLFCQPTHRLKPLLLEAYRLEPPVADDGEELPLKFEYGLWWLGNQIFVPLSLRPTILQAFHDDISAGHVGLLKTLQDIMCMLTWPGIRKDVIQYTKSCLSCQRAKHSNQQPPGLMVPLAVPEHPWSVIGIDFIVKLPLSSSFDSILVIVDHFSKAAHLILAYETWSTEEFAACFFDRFVISAFSASSLRPPLHIIRKQMAKQNVQTRPSKISFNI